MSGLEKSLFNLKVWAATGSVPSVFCKLFELRMTAPVVHSKATQPTSRQGRQGRSHREEQAEEGRQPHTLIYTQAPRARALALTYEALPYISCDQMDLSKADLAFPGNTTKPPRYRQDLRPERNQKTEREA